jgi:hypothetical protein
MANTAVSHILITSYVYGAQDILRGTEQRSIPCEGADFTEVSSEDPKSNDGVNAKITYYDKPDRVFYTSETVAQLTAQANGNLSAS